VARISLQADGLRYALAARDVLEVLPRIAMRPFPLGPPGLAGLLTYRGVLVPVMDLSLLVGGRPCPANLGTRILITYAGPSQKRRRLVGLLAENVDEILPDTPVQTGVSLPAAPFLGSVFEHSGQLIQLVEPAHLIPEETWDLLVPEGP
jgi:chemotaxis-related protein WspB